MLMKKTLVLLLVCSLTLGMISPAAFAKVEDVPSDHWAYQAVVTLVDRGYLAVYEDGTFQGSRSVDRYTLAVTVARILEEIETGQAVGTMDDAELLRELTNEFREELVEWYAEKDAMEAKLGETLRVSTTTEERLNRVVSAQVGLQEEVAGIRADLMAEAEELKRSIAEQDAEMDRQGETLRMHGDELQESIERLAALQEGLVYVEEQVQRQQGDIVRLENWAAEKSAVFAALAQTDEELLEAVEVLSEEVVVVKEDSAREIEVERQRTDELAETKEQQITELREEFEWKYSELAEQQDEMQLLLDDLVGAVGRSDGEFVRSIEHNRRAVENLTARIQEFEQDLQTLAVRLQRESQAREESTTALVADVEEEFGRLQRGLEHLTTQVGISEEELAELNRKITDEISIQMNAALIREQRLERQLKELQEEFSSFRANMESETRSAKGSATVAIALAAVGIIVGFVAR